MRRALLYLWERGGFGETRLGDREMRHIRGILDYFLADATRFLDPRDQEADKRLDDAAQQFAANVEQFGANDDQVGIAWVEYTRADLAISRAQADLAISREQADLAISLAVKSAEDHSDLGDHELLANLHRVCADAQWLRGDRVAALDAHARAVLHVRGRTTRGRRRFPGRSSANPDQGGPGVR